MSGLSSFGSPFGGWLGTGLGSAVVVIVIAWSLVWKGLALWKAARRGSKIWYIVMLVINTVGILEILYIFVFSKMGRKQVASTNGSGESHQ